MNNNFSTKQLEVDINEVFPNPYNPNRQSDETFQKEIESIKVHGFLAPILVREKDSIYEILDGEHRWRACKQLNYSKIKIESLGQVSDSIAKVLTIKLNNLRGQDDILKRAEILKQLDEGQLALLPFNRKDIEEEIKLLDFDFSQFENVKVEDDELDKSQNALQLALKLNNALNSVHSQSKNRKLRILIEGYFSWFKKFEQIIQKNEKN